MSAEAAAPPVVLTRDGDDAFKEFFRTEFPRLAGYCARLLADEQAGRDVAQEALLRTWTRWRSIGNRGAYAYLVATNLVRGEWRQRQRRQAVLALLSRERERAPATGDDRIREAVFALPAKLRDPVLLHYFADLPVTEVAGLLGSPVGTTKRRLSDARGLLEQRLRPGGTHD